MSPEKITVRLQLGFNKVHVLYDQRITWTAQPDLYESIRANITAIRGVEYVVMNSYSAVVYVATHIRSAKEVASDMYELAFDDDGDLLGCLGDEFDDFLVIPPDIDADAS